MTGSNTRSAGVPTRDRARELASWWHGGQSSALYAFASSGHLNASDVCSELAQSMREVRATNYAGWPVFDGTNKSANLRELATIARYVHASPADPFHHPNAWSDHHDDRCPTCKVCPVCFRPRRPDQYKRADLANLDRCDLCQAARRY